MTAWTVTATAFVVILGPLVWTIWHHPSIDGVIAYQLAGIVTVLLMLLLSEVYADTSFADLAVVLALLTLGSGLVFVRFLERWI